MSNSSQQVIDEMLAWMVTLTTTIHDTTCSEVEREFAIDMRDQLWAEMKRREKQRQISSDALLP